jgi:serine/threonine protein phosphatase PrpC
MKMKSKGTQVLKLDAYGHGERGAASTMEDAHGFDVATGCFVVADGLGQKQGGAEAAHLAVEHVVEACGNWSMSHPMAAARYALSRADLAVERVRDSRSLPFGTTAVVLVLREGLAAVGWCGDSRVYRLRLESVEGRVSTWRPARLTKDHRDATGTLVRNLGSQRGGASAEPEYSETEARPGDVFALVTDGVWEALGDEGVCRVMLDSHAGTVAVLNARWMAEELVHRAMERGGKDNATALVVRVPRD